LFVFAFVPMSVLLFVLSFVTLPVPSFVHPVSAITGVSAKLIASMNF
jgi:hypothetical protein